ncbi:hypothetical protein CAC42_550 [Sphaceloma murrayae]|uniref:Nucleotide-diphospho-sugar transferase n=1 Tax=Sphaceloma murrayae TaxID=2082308 RepID=A0A2K1R3T6_9PEZI|nr:hypothetical protein CAC42_550 [Sphaceloma murrayae]
MDFTHRLDWPKSVKFADRLGTDHSPVGAISELAPHKDPPSSPGESFPPPDPPASLPNVSIIPDDTRSGTETSDPRKQFKADYAFSLYVTDTHYLCNALMILDSLKAVDTKATRLLLHPDSWAGQGRTNTRTEWLLAQAVSLGAELRPIQLQHFEDGEEETWFDSYTKLLAFNQTQFRRVVSLDTDGVVMQNLDELFSLPATPIAAPRAYWLDRNFLSSQIFLIEPSPGEFSRVLDRIQHHGKDDYDMEIINHLYGSTASILPHRPYDLLTGEFRRRKNDHAAYLGSADVKWNATAELANAKYIHFSDWPVPKPWMASTNEVKKNKPVCLAVEGGPPDCADRDAWLWLYRDYSQRRKRVCYPPPPSLPPP